MKKRTKKAVALIILCSIMSMTACQQAEEYEMTQEIARLQTEKQELEAEIASLKEFKESLSETGEEGYIYIVTYKISQSHFTLDIGEHLKDAMNQLTFSTQVTEAYYNSVEVGEEVASEFRVGSLIFKSSFGSWNAIIANKEIVKIE